MFEAAELGHKIEKAEYDKVMPKLRADLLDAQFDVGTLKKFPIVVLINGVEGAGKGETVQLLNEWMDPRHIQTVGYGEPSDEERERPPMWRYWRSLPPKGKLGILFGSWYTQPILDRVFKRAGKGEFEASLERINHFERMLADEGAVILKFWFHLSKKRQESRLKALERDPDTRWRVTKRDWQFFGKYDRFRDISERALRVTGSAHAPWLVVEGSDARYRGITVGRALLAAMRQRLDDEKKGAGRKVAAAAPLAPRTDDKNVLAALDLKQTISDKAYDEGLEKWQGRLGLRVRDVRFRARRSLIVVFEGSDAAGKGGAIRRVAAAIDPRNYRIVPIAAPSEEERAQPYLWRFWRHAPRLGGVTIFDRSWYGRVLVERVEGFCAQPDWMRAYAEINEFEAQLADAGAVVCKFWLQISPQEQLRRFKERERTRFKRFKITAEDWRNRKQWKNYEAAVIDMVERTSTLHAPWTLVEADDKHFARVKILQTLAKAVEAAD